MVDVSDVRAIQDKHGYFLSQARMEEYQHQGFTSQSTGLHPTEVSILLRELERLCANPPSRIHYEANGVTPRSIFNLPAYSAIYASLIRHPAIVLPVHQLIQEPFYCFQFQLNFKVAFDGKEWPWHQDYPTFQHDDGMPDCRAVNVLIFLEDVNEFNGPMMFVPCSQKFILPLPEVDHDRTGWASRWLETSKIESIVRDGGIVAPKGCAGSIVIAHPNIVHGSANNPSPFGRALITCTYSALSTRAKGSHRAKDIVSNDYTEIQAEDDDCILRYHDSKLSRSTVFDTSCFARHHSG